MKTVFNSNQIKKVDAIAAELLKLSSFELMLKAGKSIYSYLQHYSSVLVVTGAGNNAGDGFVIAQLALQRGQKTLVWCLTNIDKLPTDAKIAMEQYLAVGGKIITNAPTVNFDCLVDAIFGTGLSRNIEGRYAEAIHWINSKHVPVIAVDIPSGLDASTGEIRGCAVKADITVCVIAYKVGLITNNGKDQCGKLFLEDLDVDDSHLKPINSRLKLLDQSILQTMFKGVLFHHHNSHKGAFGKVLVVGGHDGMLGALILAGQSALHSGCGMVEAVSNTEQSVLISIHCPEIITANNIKAARFLTSANVIAVGPGLGLNHESDDVLNYCIGQNKPMVIDADGLTLISKHKLPLLNTVLTPHPKEAASLLGSNIASVQSDRIKAALEISKIYQSVVILKGSGTVIATPNGDVFICPYGYSGMATAGMGDVLTGMVAGLMAQGLTTIQAANTAVTWHALSAENCNKGNFLVATDVIQQLHTTITHNNRTQLSTKKLNDY